MIEIILFNGQRNISCRGNLLNECLRLHVVPKQTAYFRVTRGHQSPSTLRHSFIPIQMASLQIASLSFPNTSFSEKLLQTTKLANV